MSVNAFSIGKEVVNYPFGIRKAHLSVIRLVAC